MTIKPLIVVASIVAVACIRTSVAPTPQSLSVMHPRDSADIVLATVEFILSADSLNLLGPAKEVCLLGTYLQSHPKVLANALLISSNGRLLVSPSRCNAGGPDPYNRASVDLAGPVAANSTVQVRVGIDPANDPPQPASNGRFPGISGIGDLILMEIRLERGSTGWVVVDTFFYPKA